MTPEEEAFAEALAYIRDSYLGPEATAKETVEYAVFKLAVDTRWMMQALAALAEQERAGESLH